MDVDREIRRYFRVKRGDTLPFTGWLESTRADLHRLFAKFRFKHGAEIGVSTGIHAKEMLRRIPGLELICVDTWKAFNRTSDERAAKNFETCQKRLEGRNAIYMKMASMEAVKKIPDGSLDFVYIDGLHEFDPVMMDLICWSPKVRKNGIVSGHDYFSFYQSGVIPAVNTYTRAHNINDWYITRDRVASFFWVKK